MIDSTDTNITQGKFKDWIKTSNSANPMSGSGGRGEKNEKGRSLFFLPHSWEDEDRLLEKCGVDALKTGHTYTHTFTVTQYNWNQLLLFIRPQAMQLLPREQGYALWLWAEQWSQGQGEVCPWRGTKSMWGRLSLKREMWRIFDLTSEEPNKEKDPPKTRKSLLTAKLGNNPCPGKGNHSGKISRLHTVSQTLTFYCSTQLLSCGTFAEKNDFLKTVG